MKNPGTRDAFFAATAVVAALAPFLNKAFHIDDPLFLWMAQQVSRHPADPYGFSVNWYESAMPMFSVMQNPPLNAYYMALTASLLGWSEVAMHGAFLAPAVAVVLGTFFLARRLSGSPLFAALLMLFTPVFLISATGVMCDVWLLALWVWSVECWLRGLERPIPWLLLLASILVAAAALTKYFGLALVPLLAVYTLARERRPTHRLLYLLIPIVIISGYEVITKARYGQGLFSSAMLYSWKATAKPDRHVLQQFLTGLSFAGGCLFTLLFYAPFLKLRRAPRQSSGSLVAESDKIPNLPILIVGMVIFAVLVPMFHFGIAATASSKIDRIAVAIEGALFITIGIGILVLALADVIQHKTADSLLLALWLIGTFIFAAMMNWSITGRTFLPMAPAAVILLIRRLKVIGAVAAAVPDGKGVPIPARRTAAVIWWPLLPAALVSLLITIGDYHLANTARQAASDFQQRFGKESGNIWFEGHWGFQYYMQQWRARPLDPKEHDLVSGELLIVPINNSNVNRKPAALATASPEQVDYPQFFATTISRGRGAGFYSSIWGPLPWFVGYVPPEHYLVFRIK